MELLKSILGQQLYSIDILTISLLLASLSIGYIYIVSSHTRQKKANKYPPYAPGGMWQHIQISASSQYPWWILDVARDLHNRVFQLSLPMSPMAHKVVVGEVDTFRRVLTDPLSEKPMEFYQPFRDIVGGPPTVLTSNGHEWHGKRKAVAPAFSSNHIKRMTRVALETTEIWIRDTLVDPTKNASFDVGEEMIGITLSSISETAFEYKMSTQEKKIFGRELELTLIEFALKAPFNPLRALFSWFLPERGRAFAAAQNTKAMMFQIIKSYRNMKEPLNNGTIIQLVMESDAFLTDEERAAQLMEFLIAGHDTTAYTIAWILLELARNPKEQTKLRESLSQLDPEDWSRSEYLKKVVKEGMRLYPVVAGGSVRKIGRDIMTSRNELLPKGTICFLPFILLSRNPDIFNDPDSFQPSRWETPTRDMLDAFNPFSLGKQNCVGQSLANAEVFAMVARICSELELSVESEGSVDFFLTLKPVGARLRARKV
mmetsp:Transcript_38415/g.70464  ORF Transcript_38415/g.70464 Transcript_38415/m.70464 type:complete len:486 (-) Transcript_38415:121-1578(-)